MKLFRFLTVLMLGAIVGTLTIAAKPVITPPGVSKDPRFRAIKSAEAHFSAGIEAMQTHDWGNALKEFMTVVVNFPCDCNHFEAMYLAGVAYYNLGYYQMSNRLFNRYLKEQSVPKYFEDVFCYKFLIAEHFRRGERSHLFGGEHLPRWMPATSEAVELYDEIATTLPNDEKAPHALFCKALILKDSRDYKDSIETALTLIRRYPKDPLAAASYLVIAVNYYHLNRCEPDNPDLLAMALINIRRFGQEFPGDGRVNEAMNIYCQMEEHHANALFEMGCFYQRTNHCNAAIIYYMKAAREFPETKAAAKAREHLRMFYPS